ncbi:segregation and condensation protein A [Zhihengliuella salsuginis]|uniref:Segregation and condensation protein A n=1 Tax=Zhihengliuella salsuginis TaxID=578222 RepID=A0ABQ3GLK7_9MICC|nr:segregation/condensation protein A [Zhihengliuella salsuginis]GHD08911.1 segregation/condensation protein A [Zhihengliuella salsuginis]
MDSLIEGRTEEPAEESAGFAVTLEHFSGPFEVLLNLIGKRQLDITEIALAAVTDEFIAYIRELRGRVGNRALDETTQFLVVAATLLDLKAARLVPSGEVESEEDISLLEARDLLFARLLQYKAFKAVAGELRQRFDAEGGRFPRQVSLEPRFAALLPELLWKTNAEDFAAIAEKALAPKPVPATEVGLEHLHAPAVSVREQAAVIADRLQAGGWLSFADLAHDADSTLVVVARFLALLEMYRDKAVDFDQADPLGELRVAWADAEAGWSADQLQEEYDDAPDPVGAGEETA